MPKRKPGRPQKYRTEKDRKTAIKQQKLAWYNRQKALQVPPRMEEELPDLIDTRQWEWRKFALYFFIIEITWFQVICLKYLYIFLRLILELPRRHGKTTIIIRIFCVRKLCETVLTKKDTNIAYVTANKDNVIDFVLMVAADILENERIIQNYGYLLDLPTVKEVQRVRKIKKRARRQTQMVLNLANRKDVFNPSLFGTTIKGGIRGRGFEHVFIDDPVDIFHTEDPKTARKLTKKIMTYIKEKIYPLAEKNVSIVLTRYDLDGHDISSILAAEMNYTIWKLVTYKAITVFGTYQLRDLTEDQKLTPADIIIKDTTEWELLSPFIWNLRAQKLQDMGIICSGLQLIVYLYHSTEKRYFMKEYQNEPQPIKGFLDYNWIQDYEHKPTGAKWCISVDVAAGESKKADYTAIALIGVIENKFFIQDIIWGKWTGKQKLKNLEAFVKNAVSVTGVDHRNMAILIETVRGQRDLYQRVRDESWITPVSRQPSGRGEKITRIQHGLGQEMENSQVFIQLHCRNKSQLRVEIEGFPNIDEDHIIDCLEQGIYYMKRAVHGKPVSGKTDSEFTTTKYDR